MITKPDSVFYALLFVVICFVASVLASDTTYECLKFTISQMTSQHLNSFSLPSKRISCEKAVNVGHKMVSFLVYHLVWSHFGIFKDLCYRYEASRTTKTYRFSRLKPYEKKSTHVISVVIISWYSLSTLTLQYVKASSKFMDHKTVCREMQYIHATRISGRRKSKLNKVTKYGGKYATTWVCTQALLFMILWIFLCSFFTLHFNY